MSCAIQAQWDFVVVRGNNNQKYIDDSATWTNAIGAVLNAAKATTKTNFIAGGSPTESSYDGAGTATTVEYIRVGKFQDDSSFAFVTGDIISDATGLRPARNFDSTMELNIYAPPPQKYDEATAASSTLFKHYEDLNGIVTGCNTYDVVMIDTKNQLAAIYGGVNGRVEISDLMTQPMVKLIFEQKAADKTDYFDVIDLTS